MGGYTSRMTENEVATVIVDAAYHIHLAMGPGLLESVYEAVLTHELTKRGLQVARQVAVPVVYDGMVMEAGFRADLVVDELVIVEIKCVETLLPVHKKQLLTYLRLSNKRLGLLINFYEALIKHGITRLVNGL
jgi:GxxExxY protein